MGKITQKALLEMKLHETKSLGKGVTLLRVVGGWIYETVATIDKDKTPIQISSSTTFVPEPEKDIIMTSKDFYNYDCLKDMERILDNNKIPCYAVYKGFSQIHLHVHEVSNDNGVSDLILELTNPYRPTGIECVVCWINEKSITNSREGIKTYVEILDEL